MARSKNTQQTGLESSILSTWHATFHSSVSCSPVTFASQKPCFVRVYCQDRTESFSVHTPFERRMRFEKLSVTRLRRLAVRNEFLFFCICVRNDGNEAVIRNEKLEHVHELCKNDIWAFSSIHLERRGNALQRAATIFFHDAFASLRRRLRRNTQFTTRKYIESRLAARAVRNKTPTSFKWSENVEISPPKVAKRRKFPLVTFRAHCFSVLSNLMSEFRYQDRITPSVATLLEADKSPPSCLYPKPSLVCVTGEISRIIQWNIRRQGNSERWDSATPSASNKNKKNSN